MKKYIKYLPMLAVIPFLIACGSSPKSTVTKKSNKSKKSQDVTKDTNGLDILTGQFSHNIDDIWGSNELLVASRKDYVKYTDQFIASPNIINVMRKLPR